MRIAVFGKEKIIDRVTLISENFDDMDIVPLFYEKPEETLELIERAFNCDVYLFTEPLAYLAVQDKIEKKRLPTVQVAFNAFSVASTFYQAQKEKHATLQHIGIDLVNNIDIDQVLRELGHNEHNIHLFTHISTDTAEEVIQHYEDLLKNEELDHVFTVSDEIYHILQEKEIPVSLFEIPTSNIKQALEKAVALNELKHASNNQIVTGIISLRDSVVNKSPVDSPNKATLEHMRNIIHKFTEQTNSSFFEDSNQRFIITGTDKLLHHLRSNYREFPLLQSFISNMNESVYIGFGLGLHAKEASNHAELALKYCKQSEYSISYIVNEREEVIGPIGIKKEIDTSLLYNALIHKAKLNNELSYNFINFVKERNNESFSSNDIALFYNVTKRSAERTINKLLEGDVIQVSGEERPYAKGRPRKLFSLKQ